ncbi:MAG: AAA family ATPase [Burkholderiaceae bacterium]
MSTQTIQIDQTVLHERSARLAQVATELKQELHGIDAAIDQVIEAIRAWYVMPHLIGRPVIVCLWGLTGTGKTQLTRSLARKLGFYDRFVEVQMDGFASGSSWRSESSISAMLSESGVVEGEPGILVLDEFQRFRTIDKQKQDVAVKRYQDVWQLLSDGKLPPALSILQELESAAAYSQYSAQWDKDNDDEDDSAADESAAKKTKKARLFKISPYEAREIKQALKRKEPLAEIMTWSSDVLQAHILDYKSRADTWETDYSRLLIIVSGNLDEMYSDLAARVEDCDTDADVFHKLSRQLSIIDVKQALNTRFRPEQVARLGNTHVIYPSLNTATYRYLIDKHCRRYADNIEQLTGYRIVLDATVRDAIYANGVFPAQGTRPLFSTIHSILSAPLVNTALWAAQNGVALGVEITLRIDLNAQKLFASAPGHAEVGFAITLDIERIKRRASPDFRALLAVHEAGHGLAYARLFGHAPQEIKINVASFEGGYNSYVRLKARSRQNCLDDICVSLAGRAAEELVFGKDACSTGAFGDIKQATAAAARFVRHYGFGSRLAHTDITDESDENFSTDVEPTNAEIEALLAEQYARACGLIKSETATLLSIVRELLAHSQLSAARMGELLGVPIAREDMIVVPYAEKLRMFAIQNEAMERIATPEANAQCAPEHAATA